MPFEVIHRPIGPNRLQPYPAVNCIFDRYAYKYFSGRNYYRNIYILTGSLLLYRLAFMTYWFPSRRVLTLMIGLSCGTKVREKSMLDLEHMDEREPTIHPR